jgi:hypothetical protein
MSGEKAADAIASEISTLTALAGDYNSKYWKGPEAEALQARFEKLLATQEAMR